MADGNLFGAFDPRLMQQALQQEAQKNLMTQAQLTPEQYLRFSAGMRGQMLGQGVQQLFGLGQTDPRLQQASDAQAAYQEALSSTGEANSPQFFRAFADAAARRNLPSLAQQAASQAANIESTLAQTFQRQAAGTASLAQATREAKPEAPLTIADRARLTQLQREFGEEEGAVRFRQERDEAERQKAAASAPPQTPTEKALNPVTAKTRGDILNSALNAQNTLTIADAMDRVLSNAFTGVGSGAKLTIGQVATALGVDVKGVTETEQLTQLLAGLTQGQARNLPGALSDKDVNFLKEAIGKGSFTLATLQATVRRIRTEALKSEIENSAVQNVINTGGDLNKFDFVANRKAAQAQAEKQIKEQEDKQKRLLELRRKKGS